MSSTVPTTAANEMTLTLPGSAREVRILVRYGGPSPAQGVLLGSFVDAILTLTDQNLDDGAAIREAILGLLALGETTQRASAKAAADLDRVVIEVQELRDAERRS